jgi:hypothetical protein
MKIVKDDQGRPWQIAVTAASALRVEQQVQAPIEREVPQADGTTKRERTVAPFAIADITAVTNTLTVLRSGFVVTAQALWAIVQPQAAAKNISQDEFLDALSGDVLEQMATALAEELIEFFPAAQRPMVRTLRTKMDEVAATLIQTAQTRIEEIDTGEAIRIAATANEAP